MPEGTEPTQIATKSREQVVAPHALQAKRKWWQLGNSSRIPLTERLFLIQNLAVMVRAGLPLSRALSTLAEQSSSRTTKRIMGQLHDDVEHGQTLAEAMEKFPKSFGPLFVNMVRVGELSGTLESILQQLYVQLKKDHELVSKVRGAMIYPVVVLVAMVGIAAFMMTFVIPKLTPQFAELGAELPLPTKILIGVSNFFSEHALIAFTGAIAAVLAITWLIHRPLQGPWHRLILMLPVFGKIARKINLARFTLTVGSLIKTDVPIVQTVRITASTLANRTYRDALATVAEQLKQGTTMHESLAAYPRLFPPLVTQMVAVGEETGSLDSVLGELATFFDEDVNQTMKDLPTVIEPLLMILMGIGVGGMAVAMLLPMYAISSKV